MNMHERVSKLSTSLKSIAEELDIPESTYLEAVKRYQAVGEWLNGEGSHLAKYAPEIYPQGSFRLGTVVKPISDKDEYDVDLVCFLAKLSKADISQKELKNVVGERLKKHETYKRLLDEEGRRCWTLNYANEFHMDILPSIADLDHREQGGFYRHAILITDTQNAEQEWPKSNPEGYAEWFFSRHKSIFMTRKKKLAEMEKAAVEDIPDYKIKTPLQRSVQILKRHRDFFFSRRKGDCKPISIIITTLAATLYKGQDNIYDTTHDILQGIDEKMVVKEGKFYIGNPVSLEENFAEKWNEDSNLPKAFFEWITDAKRTFCEDVIKQESDLEIAKTLKESLGSAGAAFKDKEQSFAEPIIVKSPSKPWCD